MNCPDCGCAVAKTDHFCRKCYARLEPPSLWRRIISFFKNLSRPGSHLLTVKKTVTIKTVDKDGTEHEYHSLGEAPLALQQEVAKLQSQMKLQVESLPEEGLIDSDTTRHSGVTVKKSVSIYRIKDAYGKETVYHSLNELPPQIRAAIEKAQEKPD